MTVCAAAIYSGRGIIGASDRMLTFGEDMQFEPARTKIYTISNSIVIMTAGDASVSYEAVQAVRQQVALTITRHPEIWHSVAAAAELFRTAYNDLRKKAVEKEYLARLGLTWDDFWQNQDTRDGNLLSQIASEVTYFKFSGVEALICGVDDLGPHLYEVRNSTISCWDSLGFAAIGIGASHAQSLFMFESHTIWKSALETMYRVHAAKKRAEVSPGVGVATDMFSIAALGGYAPVKLEIIQDLEKNYKKAKARHEGIDKRIYKELNDSEEEYFKKREEAAKQSQVSEEESSPDGDVPTDQDGISNDSKKS